jgi:hypothetical protein
MKYKKKDLCLTLEEELGKVHLNDCIDGNESQMWIWKNIKPKI